MESHSVLDETALGGKYLTFTLGRESYGVNVLKIREIIRLAEITLVPQMPAHVRGVINLRGKIVPVIDLRIRFALANRATTERTCIIIAQVATATRDQAWIGFIVDAVEDVLNLNASEIEETPNFSQGFSTTHLLGIARARGKVTALLNLDELLRAEANVAV
jgi:purine-binding chemotaxis protein CheW